ncbi:MAG: hypothetical protein A3J80_06260 [Desulfobacula sp. RIFOXYB2_FULL_45_6]|nr:MAG: hypothetical protein A3J80_06260 [Desulfobacula sp. RIFOXYB2_FULL_45_6]
MDINSLRGVSAYTSTQNTTPPVDQTVLQNQNLEASKAELTKENADVAQKAFEVTITEEAQKKIAAETTQKTSEALPEPPVDQSAQTVSKAYETSQIVNIVA